MLRLLHSNTRKIIVVNKKDDAVAEISINPLLDLQTKEEVINEICNLFENNNQE